MGATRQGEVVYDSTVDGLLRGMGSKVTPLCKERLRQAGMDLDQKLKPYYPRLVHFRCVDILCEELYPKFSRDEALFEMGKAFVAGFQQTTIGKTVARMAKLLGPRRTLERMTQNMESGNNYLETSFADRGPGKCEIELNQVSNAPGYFKGVLLGSMQVAGAANPRILVLSGGGAGCRYLVEWDEADPKLGAA